MVGVRADTLSRLGEPSEKTPFDNMLSEDHAKISRTLPSQSRTVTTWASDKTPVDNVLCRHHKFYHRNHELQLHELVTRLLLTNLDWCHENITNCSMWVSTTPSWRETKCKYMTRWVLSLASPCHVDTLYSSEYQQLHCEEKRSAIT